MLVREESPAFDPYQTLQVDPHAPRALIADAYWQLISAARAGTTTPDWYIDQLNEAYALLMDVDRRRALDEARRIREPAPPAIPRDSREKNGRWFASIRAAEHRPLPPDYYALLNVDREASASVIDLAATFALRSAVHMIPAEEAELRSAINDARRVLSDPTLRAEYDASVRGDRDGTTAPAAAQSSEARGALSPRSDESYGQAQHIRRSLRGLVGERFRKPADAPASVTTMDLLAASVAPNGAGAAHPDGGRNNGSLDADRPRDARAAIAEQSASPDAPITPGHDEIHGNGSVDASALHGAESDGGIVRPASPAEARDITLEAAPVRDAAPPPAEVSKNDEPVARPTPPARGRSGTSSVREEKKKPRPARKPKQSAAPEPAAEPVRRKYHNPLRAWYSERLRKNGASAASPDAAAAPRPAKATADQPDRLLTLRSDGGAVTSEEDTRRVTPAAPSSRAELRFTNGPRAGHVVPIGEGVVTLGDRGECDDSAADPTDVGTPYARVWQRGDHCMFRQVGDTTVLVGGEPLRIPMVVLEDGDQITIGDNVLVFAERRA